MSTVATGNRIGDFLEHWQDEQIDYKSMDNDQLLLCYACAYSWGTKIKDGRVRLAQVHRRVMGTIFREIMSRMTTPSPTPPE